MDKTVAIGSSSFVPLLPQKLHAAYVELRPDNDRHASKSAGNVAFEFENATAVVNVAPPDGV